MLFFSKKYNARHLQFQHYSFKVIWNGTTNQKVYVSFLRTTTWCPSSTSDASKGPNDLEASFFLTLDDALVSQEHTVLFFENHLCFFLLFAKFGLKTNALLLEKMWMEMFYTWFYIYSKQFSLYHLVMWFCKTYILTILYNSVSVQILNWKSIFVFQFRFWTETTTFSSDSELKIYFWVSVQILNWNYYLSSSDS